MTPHEPEISVVVSTRDRRADLERLLASVAAAAEGRDVEVVVVDNGSRDGTPALCEDWAGRDPARRRVVREPRAGKSVALNTGLEAARGRVIAFTDDDCIVAPSWLDRIAAEFAADPGLAILGGRVELHDPRDLPVTLVTAPDRAPVRSLREIYPTPRVIGANMAIARWALERIGSFDEAMGPGTPIVAEDTDVVYRAVRAGLRVVYEPSVVVFHNHGRRDPAAVAGLDRVYRLGRGAFLAKHALRGDRAAARFLAADVWDGLNRAVGRGAERPTPSYLSGLLAGVLRRLGEEARAQVGRTARRRPA